jgi:hypothetical protein
VLSSAQILGHQKADRISIPECQPFLHQSYGLGMTGLKGIFAENDHVWAPIGYQEALFP